MTAPTAPVPTAPAPGPPSAAPSSTVPARTLLGPGAPAGWDWDGWAAHPGVGVLAVSGRWDEAWEAEALAGARRDGVGLLSVRVTGDAVMLGPLRPPADPDGTPAACAGCVVTRLSHRHRPEGDAAMVEFAAAAAAGTPAAAPAADLPAAGPRRSSPWLSQAVAAYGQAIAESPLGPGDLVVLRGDGTVRRHRVRRTHRCPVCGTPRAAAADPDSPPPTPPRHPRPAAGPVPTRAGAPYGLDPDRMRRALADPRFGPAVRTVRDSQVPFAMAEVRLLGGAPAGHGRARTYREAEAIAYLEAYERMGGYPNAAPLVTGRTPAELGDRALDPARLGSYDAEQLAHPLSRVRPWTRDTPMDWVWGHRLHDGEPLLVPADAGFYQYRYPPREPGDRRLNHVLESSSGCALGSSVEEAALQSLLELAERDAFLIGWHRQRPLPVIDPATVTDPESRLLLRMAAARGFEVRLLAASADIPVPVVWALAVRPDRALPAAFSTAGCHPDPETAVRSALWELSQLTENGLTWDPAAVDPMVEDPWLVTELMDHPHRNADPRLLPRVERVLGGPELALGEAFPGWPEVYVRAAGGYVDRGLEFVAELYRRAGLTEIVLVDQSTPEHTDAGLAVVKAVVPGIVPMCFGQVHQRFGGLRRLRRELPDPDGPLDPHPFP
ncbi:YcaO-like family protein [Kitasatospora sp. NPDC088391]|uniref:YcaO-like family protein n=1 Tax=Kitasatospora sp. NPDC088391 TaxID=3364074 RepID=UPI003814CE7F